MNSPQNLFSHAFHTLLLKECEDGVVQVTLNRPQAHNAYNAQMVAELGQVLEQVEQRADLRVVILTGAGEKTFCAGADLREAFIDGGKGLLNAQEGFNPLHRMPRRKVWIAALNGHAYGGGLELALHCDLIIAASHVQLSLPETRHSLLPVGGGISQLSRLLPAPIVREMVLAGMPLEASRAERLGLINQVVEGAVLLPAAQDLAARLNRNAPLAVQAANALIDLAVHGPAALLPAEVEKELAQLQQSDDYQEADRALQEKRPPFWKGQ
ncbi:enoyl-CoA hydratase/isomerase family protein [Rouxiella chamberiensis]|uniref:Enoyl-CoA hydratase-related protein n=1 Tax=Rouxiella chamberiensis TaxID=1513468 RepID=A0ABY7HR11_9GAMM|nr:enoyl-CoA hydratase-related protein [Rouxiella chamberiensis]WAT01837.1 enoyl-CoA hydratase-related protein [Rouxiella chamberiensis]